MEIKVKYFRGQKPLEEIPGGDWIDLRCSQDIVLFGAKNQLVPLGIAMELPKGYEAVVAPRGSTYKKYGFIQTNSIGVIDNAYCGDTDEWFLPILILNPTKARVKAGTRIAQFRIQKKQPKLEFKTVKILGNPDRGSHGSTGER